MHCIKSQRLPPQNKAHATFMQPLQCGSQQQLANLHLSTHRTTPEHQMTTVMQPFQCDLQAQIPKHPITTHTQAHPKQLEATVTLRQKKTTNRPQPQPPHRRGTFHRRLQPLYTEKHKVSRSGFLPKTKPMQHHAAITMRFAAATRKLAPIYAQNNTRTPNDNSHAAIPMRSASTDSKTPYNYAHTSTPKAAWSHRYTAAKKKRPTDPSRNRRTHEVPFIVACSQFTRKNTRFRAPGPPQNKAHATFMQPLQCGSQQQLANLHLSTHRTTPEHQMTTVMQPFQCDLQAQIPKHPITTHTQAHPKQLEATVTLRQKKTDQPTPAATAAHTRYLSSSPAATLHGKTQGFVLRLPPQNIAHATFMQPFQCDLQPFVTTSLLDHFPSSPLPFSTTYLPHHFPSSPLPFFTTSLLHHFPSSPLPFSTTSLPHHFPSSPLPFIITSLRHHFPSPPLPFLTTSLLDHFPSSPLPFATTSLPHHFPSPPLTFLTTSLPHHSPSSPLPFFTTSLRHHFPSPPLPFLTTSLRHHFPSSPLPFLTTSLPHHFPSSPLPFVTTSLRHHSPSSPLPFFTTSLLHHFPSSPHVV